MIADEILAVRDQAARMAANPDRCGPRGCDPGEHVACVWNNFCDYFDGDYADFLRRVEFWRNIKRRKR